MRGCIDGRGAVIQTCGSAEVRFPTTSPAPSAGEVAMVVVVVVAAVFVYLPESLVCVRHSRCVLELAHAVPQVPTPVSCVHSSVGVFLHAVSAALVVLKSTLVAPTVFVLVHPSTVQRA